MLLVLASLVVVGGEAWQILTQPAFSTDETVVERLGWPLVPGVIGVGVLLERWLTQRSIDVRRGARRSTRRWQRPDQSFFALLGCTRFGSPGILG